MRVLVVSNPRATATTARQRDVLVHALASVADLEVAETENRGHAAALACRAMRTGADVVVALGGDGTVNEVLNGLLTDDVHPGVPALGVVPAGSTNVFARALGLPNDPIEATALLLSALRGGQRRPVSVGQADERWFAFASGIGFDAAIVGGVEGRRRTGHRSTHALYARVGVREFVRSDRRHPRLHVELDDGSVLDGIFWAVVTNADPWTYAGNRPLRPTPETGFETGLGLYARRRMGAPGLLASMVRMTGANPSVGRRGARLFQDLDHATVRADEPLPVQVDGDYIGLRDKVSFRSVRSALEVVMSPDPPGTDAW